jgi:1-acyl-sn-glycerol-3-phosphate acyltransferase
MSALMSRLRAVFIIAASRATLLGSRCNGLLRLYAGAAPFTSLSLVASVRHAHQVIGKPVRGEGVLMVANHRAGNVIVIFQRWRRCLYRRPKSRPGRFRHPGRLQRTVFVEREGRSTTREVRDVIRDRLLAGDTLLLFPEGTSHDGNRVLPFKSALLGAAEARLANGAHVIVQPVSAAYTGLHGLPMGRENRPLFAWYGAMEMVPHLWEALLAGPLDVVVQFHEPLSLDRMDRKALATRARQTVQAGLARALAGRA